MADAIKWFNVVLALLGSLAALGAIVKSNWRTTRPCVGAAMVLIAAGLGGQWLGELRGDWARMADTATFGGILVLLIASQKVPTWFLERWANPAASLIAIAVGAVFLCALLTQPAQAADDRVQVTISAEAAERCEREGGCVLVTRALLGRLAQAIEASEEQVRNAEQLLAEAQLHCPRPGARRALGLVEPRP